MVPELGGIMSLGISPTHQPSLLVEDWHLDTAEGALQLDTVTSPLTNAQFPAQPWA